MGKKKRKKENIEDIKHNQDSLEISYISQYLKEKLGEVFILHKIPHEKIIKPNVIFNTKKGIKIILGKNEINNIPHFINWSEIHGLITLPENIILKDGVKKISFSSLQDIDKIKESFKKDKKLINQLKLFTNILAFGGRDNFRNGNTFLGNLFLKNATHLFDLRLYLEKSYERISRIYKRNYIEKDISEIIFAEVFLNFILGNKNPKFLNYSVVSIDLATFNEDHYKKIDHIVKITNTYGNFEYDIQVTIGNIKRKNDTLKIKLNKDLKNPYIILSLDSIFQNVNLPEIKKLYEDYISNKKYLDKTIGGNFFPYFFRNLPEGLVKGLKETVNSLIYFLAELSNNEIILKENNKIDLNEFGTTIIIEKTPSKYKKFKNDVFFINIQHNGTPLADLRYIKPNHI